jgi:uncharacterized phiE125 gp8 family phage protein
MKTYGELRLTPSQTFTEVLTKEDVRTWLGAVPPQDAVDQVNQDALLDSLIIAARSVAELAQHADLVEKQWDLHLDMFPGYPDQSIELRYPLQSVDTFRKTDSKSNVTTLVEGTDYIVDKARGLVTPPWGQIWPLFTPRPSSAIFIQFTSGYTADDPYWQDVGMHVLQGMRLLVTGWHEGRFPFGRQVLEFPYGPSALLSYGARPLVY